MSSVGQSISTGEIGEIPTVLQEAAAFAAQLRLWRPHPLNVCLHRRESATPAGITDEV
jgi:hypothetical protein